MYHTDFQPPKENVLWHVLFYSLWLFEHSHLSVFQIYLCTNNCFNNNNNKKKAFACGICTDPMNLLHDLSFIIVYLVLKMDVLHKGTLAWSHGWKCISLWNIQMWTRVSRVKMEIYIFDKIWNCCMSCSRPRCHMGHCKTMDSSNRLYLVQQQVSLEE